MTLSPASRTELLDMARRSLRAAVFDPNANAAIPPPANPQLLQPAGCFVSLHERESHRLRGCIGRLEASGPLWRVAVETAVNVLSDPRFADNRVTPAELAHLTIELSVLSPLHPASSPTDFDAERDGIHLTIGEQTGCFLPQVARETGWSKEMLLDRLCTEKLGLPADAWRNRDVKMMRFSTIVVGPEALGP